MPNKTYILLTGLLVASLSVAGCKKQGGTGPSAPVDANQVKKEMSQAAQTTGEYLTQQKDAAVQAAQQTYDQLQNETEQVITKLKASGQENAQKLTADLQTKLDAASQKFTDLKAAGQDKWQDAKKAFDTAITELQDAYQKTKAQLQSTG